MAEEKITEQDQIKARIKLLGKLSKIQEELFVPKEKDNNYGGYKYRTAEDIFAAVKPLCAKNKCVVQCDTRIEVVDLGEKKSAYIKAHAILADTETGYQIVIQAYAREEDMKKGMDASQTTGSATSYARKYALSGLFGIDNEKDQDVINKKDKYGNEPDKDGKHETVSAMQMNAIKAELDRTGISLDVILDAVKKDKLELLTQADYVEIIRRLNATQDKEA